MNDTNKVIIGVAIEGYRWYPVSSQIKDKLNHYKNLKFKIQKQPPIATKGNLTYFFFDKNRKESWRGLHFDDVIGDIIKDLDDEILSLIK